MKEKNDGTVAKVDLTLFYNHLKEFFFSFFRGTKFQNNAKIVFMIVMFLLGSRR